MHDWSSVEQLLATGEAAAALRAFEARLPFHGVFGCGELLPRLAAAYVAAGRLDAAVAVGVLADPHGPDVSDPEAAAILADPAPEAALLHAPQRIDGPANRPRTAALFELVAPHLPPPSEYWLYFRMARAYADLGRHDARFVMAALALWMDPRSPTSWSPAHDVLTWFRSHGRPIEAARILRHWQTHFPENPLVDAATSVEVAAAAGPPGIEEEGRIDRRIVAAEWRQPQPWFCYGDMVPHALRGLAGKLERRAIIIVTEVSNARLMILDDAVVVQAADGAVLTDLCVGTIPELVRRRLLALGDDVEHLELDAAVLVSDSFPSPNLCHFMLDQATRLELYRLAGVRVEDATVIGPNLVKPYQRDIADRFGARTWLGTRRRARLRVRSLHVSSTCRASQHTAHWGAQWALVALRAKFGIGEPPAERRRLLISRNDADSRRMSNETEVLELLRHRGFERIVPGKMPLEDQVAAFAAASQVVAVHGAGLANIVFCAPGTQVLEIFPPGVGTWSYAILPPSLGLAYATMVGLKSGVDDVIVELDEMRRWLDDVAA